MHNAAKVNHLCVCSGFTLICDSWTFRLWHDEMVALGYFMFSV